MTIRTQILGPARVAAVSAAAGAALLLALAACDDPATSGAAATPAARPAGDPAAGGSTTAARPAPAAWDPGPPNAEGPAIAFESEVLDFGRFREDELRSGVFRFASMGSEPLRILSVKATCGCTVPELAKSVYEPGEQGTIAITFDPTSPGEQSKYVNVITNAAAGPIRLEVKAQPAAILEIEPRILHLDAARLGETHVRTVELVPMTPAFVVASVTTTNPSIRAVPGPARADGVIPLEVTVPSDLPWGPVFSWVEVTVAGPDETGTPIRFSSRFRVQGSLYGDVVCEPAIMNTLRFGVEPGERFQREVMLARRSNQPLELEVASVEFPAAAQASVRIAPGPSGAQRVILEAVAGQQRAALARGWVELRTNVPGEETITIPISGKIGRD